MVSNDSLKFVESRNVKISIPQIFILFHVFIRIHKNNNYKTSAIFVNPVTYIYVTVYMKTRPVAQKKFLSYGYSLVEETFLFLKRPLI